MKNETTNFKGLPRATGPFSAKTCIRTVVNRLLPFAVAVTMATSGSAQNADNSHRISPATHKGGLPRLPGERMTSAQRQAIASLGPDVSVRFGDQEVPSSITGPLGNRIHPDDLAAEAQAALDRYGAAFRRGTNDGFSFGSSEPDKTGALNVRMTQTFKGLTVIGGQLTVRLSQGQITGISGRFLPDLEVSTELDSTPVQALTSAISHAREAGYQNVQVVRAGAAVVFADNQSTAHLAIPVEITHNDVDGNDHENTFVDASTGQVLATSPLAPMSIGGGGGCPTGPICLTTQVVRNPDFELGEVYWSGAWPLSNIISLWGGCYSGYLCANLNGYDYMYQIVTIPNYIKSATLSFYIKISTEEGPWYPYDTLEVQIRYFPCNGCGLPTILSTPATYSNVSAWYWPFSSGNWIRQTVDVTKYMGQTIGLYFQSRADDSLSTSFMLDNVSLTVQ